MSRNKLFFLVAVLVITSLCFGQELPIPGSTMVLVDSSTHFRIIGGYRSDNNVAFYEPTTGNLLVAYYYIGTSGEVGGQRRIVAATSVDTGKTWTVNKTLNDGVSPEMNAYYPVAYGNASTPIVVYYNRANTDPNITSQPVMATDLLGWGGGLWQNEALDSYGSADTALDHRYHTMTIAPDNPDLWLVGGVQYAPAGYFLSVYRSADGGDTWSRQIKVATAVAADSLESNYVYSWSSSTPPTTVTAGPNNMVYGVFQAKQNTALDIERVFYVTSEDGGLTWNDPMLIPGTENLWFETGHVYRTFATLLDAQDNWHVFAIGKDTAEVANSYRVWDFRYDGETWNITKFGFPQYLNDGIAQPDVGGSPDEEDVMNSPAIGPDGTLYYAYTDVWDTTGSGGNALAFKYRIYVMISQDNGTTWEGPTAVYDDPAWPSEYPCDMTRTASDKLHFFFRKGEGGNDEYKELHYLGVPTQGIKDMILSIPDNVVSELPSSPQLYQNYPNPFNPRTTIRFDLVKKSHVRITIFNLLGQQIETILDKQLTAGSKAVVWDASRLPSGKYFYRLQTDNYTAVKEMTVIK